MSERHGAASRPASTQVPEAVDPGRFRAVVGRFASGVAVVSTRFDDRLFGTTVSAVSSLSAEPPMMLVCLNRASTTHDAVMRSGRYAISVLAADQDDLARHFSRAGTDKFADVDHVVTDHGLPTLTNALATLECLVEEVAAGGSHTVFLGRVLDVGAREGEPLAYYRGAFSRLVRAERPPT
ncbi:flavin reductase family protein [Nocardioides sp. DS6]|uniref:Flavin reductase family protein n=1 Tax=Nocardioides eburneus TaxID=3231482 RepID=A0ABV3T4X5_9ACTN